MADFLLTRTGSIYAGAYFGAVFLMAIWEAVAPRRSSTAPLGKRWRTNISLALIDSALMRWVSPITAITAAVIVSERGWGLFNGMAVPYWLAFTCSLLFLDLAGFGQHFLLHNIPASVARPPNASRRSRRRLLDRCTVSPLRSSPHHNDEPRGDHWPSVYRCLPFSPTRPSLRRRPL